MGTGSKVASVILRLGELCCAAIVTAILNRFFYLVNLGNGWYHGRLIYAEVIAILGIVVSIILLPPLKYSFYAWPIDVIVFVAWLVAFSLLANLTAGHTCSATWYWSYWGVYWGRFWNPGLVVTPALIGGAGCSSWTAVLTFLFMGSMAFLLSSILGVGVFMELRAGRKSRAHTAFKEKIKREKHQPLASENPVPPFSQV